jgi:hypothetical protein
VFAEEIKLAAHVVAERFDSASRQLLLINDHRDFDSYPLATVSGLRYGLERAGQKDGPGSATSCSWRCHHTARTSHCCRWPTASCRCSR